MCLHFNAEVWREDIFEPRVGNEISHEINNDNEVRVVNFGKLEKLIVNSTMNFRVP
jgi:hypothetical protein